MTHSATHVEIHFTVDDRARADSISGVLLADRLVACAQLIGPIQSRYWWRGALEQSAEWLVVLKTRSSLADSVIDTIVANHPYETPEIVVVPIVAGHAGYLGWVDEVTAEAPGPVPGERGGPGARDGTNGPTAPPAGPAGPAVP